METPVSFRHFSPTVCQSLISLFVVNSIQVKDSVLQGRHDIQKIFFFKIRGPLLNLIASFYLIHVKFL